MSNLTRAMMMGAAGASGDKIYVDDVFSTFIYDGNSGTQSINNGIDLAGEGGLIWIKTRNDNSYHFLTDTARGVNKHIASNATDAEGNVTAITAFNSNGFSLANQANVNQNYNYVSWTFRKAPGFFDVVTYTGNGTNRTISHNLGSVPGMIVIKETSQGNESWAVYHRSLGATKVALLNDTSQAFNNTDWNNTSPTSSVFTVGTQDRVNTSGESYVAYLFAHDDAQFGTDSDESIIKCGTYTGNGSTTGPVINLGFEPQFLIVKQTSQSGANWVMVDTMRGMTADGVDQQVYANLGSDEAEVTRLAPLANGFQPRFAGYEVNTSGQTYIYMAIRRPNKPPEAATDVFAIDTARGTSPSPPQFTSGFAVDLAINKPAIDGTNNWKAHSRLTGNSRMYPNNDNIEDTGNTDLFDFMDGYTNSAALDANNLAYMFKRAPGFIDVVTYTGTGSARTQNHNLGAVPELMIVKRRDSTNNWHVYSATLGATKRLTLDGTGGENIYPIWNNTAPTSTVFSMNHNAAVNGSGGTYLALLFATLPGVSKVGSYSGTGNAVNVDCGFTNGARFILIKRTDNTGDWYVWDTTRGIVSGNDPYLLLNTNAAQVTNTDYIDPLSSGFTVTASAPDALNVSGGTYLFLAIA